MENVIKKNRENYRNEIRKEKLNKIINDKRLIISQNSLNLEENITNSLDYISNIIDINVNIKIKKSINQLIYNRRVGIMSYLKLY